MTHTRTMAVLDLSPAAFQEIKERLEAVGHGDRCNNENEGRMAIDMNGIAVRQEAEDSTLKVFLVYQGGPLKK